MREKRKTLSKSNAKRYLGVRVWMLMKYWVKVAWQIICLKFGLNVIERLYAFFSLP